MSWPILRRLSCHTLTAGGLAAGAVIWQRSLDGKVRKALDRYEGSSTTIAALNARQDLYEAVGRRDTASTTVKAAAAVAGAMLLIDLARSPGDRPVAGTGASTPSRRPRWSVAVDPAPLDSPPAVMLRVTRTID
jgi:hypothetical protein